VTAPNPHVTISPTVDKTVEVWYELEWSRPGADDWFAEGGDDGHADTAQGIAIKLVRKRAMFDPPLFDYRATRKTLTTENLGL
jgi:hypothetical protein